MFTTTKRFGFTIIELLMVITIMGVLASISGSNFFRYYEKAQYESFIYKTQQFTQLARGKSLVNQAAYQSGTDTYSDPKSHGVTIERVSSRQVDVTFSQYDYNDVLDTFENEEILETASLETLLEVEDFSGVVSQSSTAAAAFDTATIYFQPGSDPLTSIRTNAAEDLRTLQLILSHHRRDAPKGLYRKFSIDTISKISEVNAYPTLVGVESPNNTTLIISSNAVLDDIPTMSAAQRALFNINGNTPNTGTISQKTITLTMGAALAGEINISNIVDASIQSTAEGIPLQASHLKIDI